MNEPQKIVRTRSGCVTCRSRRIKCDETLPRCEQCVKRGLVCPGYEQTLRWSKQYQKPKVHQDHLRSPAKPETVSERLPEASQSIVLYRTQQLLETQTGARALRPNLETIDGHHHDLLQYYFSTVCEVISGFDSAQNPFRTQVARLACQESIVYHCILSVSAAHLYQQSWRLHTDALQCRTAAMSSLASTLSNATGHTTSTDHRSADLIHLLLGSVLLGMTCTWHEPSSLGQPYLRGARALLQSLPTSKQAQHHRQTPLYDFLVGTMAFWEALTSFHLDQDPSEVDYLAPLCRDIDARAKQANPWTGSTAALFVLVARVGSITNQRRLTNQIAVGKSPMLLESATAIAKELEEYTISQTDQLCETDDECTPAIHFNIMSEVYKLTAQLELYRVFPELFHHQVGAQQIYAVSCHSMFLRSLATKALTKIMSISTSSGTKAIQQFPLVIAGSLLQYDLLLCHLPFDSGSPDQPRLDSQADVAKWRSMVRDRLTVISKYVALESARRGLKIVEQVWKRADEQTTGMIPRCQGCSASVDLVDWLMVMKEQSLTTLLG